MQSLGGEVAAVRGGRSDAAGLSRLGPRGLPDYLESKEFNLLSDKLC